MKSSKLAQAQCLKLLLESSMTQGEISSRIEVGKATIRRYIEAYRLAGFEVIKKKVRRDYYFKINLAQGEM